LAWDKLVSAQRVRLLLTATVLFVLKDTASVMMAQVIQGRQFAHLLGSTSRDAFLRRWTGDYADVVAFVNEHVPRESRLLMLFDARGYHFHIPVIQDNGAANWPLLAARATAPDCLRSAGITHVLVNRGALDYYARRGLDLGPLRLDALERFARECLSPIYSSGGITVFRVGGGAASGAARAR